MLPLNWPMAYAIHQRLEVILDGQHSVDSHYYSVLHSKLFESGFLSVVNLTFRPPEHPSKGAASSILLYNLHVCPL